MHSISAGNVFNIGTAIMRFSEGGGVASQPPHPVLITLSPSGVMRESEVRRMDVQMRLGGGGQPVSSLSYSPRP